MASPPQQWQCQQWVNIFSQRKQQQQSNILYVKAPMIEWQILEHMHATSSVAGEYTVPYSGYPLSGGRPLRKL